MKGYWKMKKRIISVIMSMLLVVLSYALTSCGGDPVSHSVKFMNGEEVVYETTFKEGETELHYSEIPSVPSKEHYEGAWEEYTLGTEDIVVNAVYTPIEYTATFKVGNEVVEEVKFTVETTALTEPTVPAKDGYIAGWADYTLEPKNFTVKAVYYKEISTKEQLKAIDDLWGNYRLTADIDLAGESWTPLAFYMNDEEVEFCGTFDGNGFKIKNLTISSMGERATRGYGLFSQNKGTIKDLGLENVNISFNVDSSWGIDGFGALAGYNEGKIIDCYATGSISLTGEAVDTAGLVGWNAEGSFERCYAAVNVTVNSGYDSVACGGLVGRNSGSVKNCYATGNVSVNARNAHAGGLVGEIGGNYAEVVNCYATGNAVANGKYTTAGGLVGWGYNIKNCFATGSVSSYASGNANSQAHAGGAVGKTNMSTSDYEKVYSPEGQSISASDNQNTAPIETVTTAESLKSAAFLKDTLGFSEELWTIADGAYPTLK